jgi:hypothetical protein
MNSEAMFNLICIIFKELNDFLLILREFDVKICHLYN